METKESLEDLFRKYKQGSRVGYDFFVSTLANPDTEDKVLLKSLKTLKDGVTLLDREHEGLVSVLLKIDWCSKKDAVVNMYQSVVLNLVSIQTYFLQPCLRMIVKKFTPIGKIKDVEDSISEERVVSDSRTFLHAHSLLRAIIKIVPMASSASVLLPLLVSTAPYIGKHVYMQECYTRNLIQVTTYIPSLRLNLIEIVVHRIIEFDIQAPRAKLLESINDESQESGIFNMEESSSCQEYGEKLDVMMVLLFEYVKSVCFTDGELDWEATKRFYREMLYIFEKILLPTHACSHTQFIMFYIVSLRTELCDGFLDYLWKYVQNPNVQGVYRQAAVTYIGSLLARGKFVCVRTLMRTLELMTGWVHNYTQTCNDCVMADITHHGPFYSVCQAIFYVLAFRQKELFETKKGLKWAERLHLQHLVQSRLNPLKVCMPLIVKTFASVVRTNQLAFCDHIIEQNSRSFIPVVSDGTQKILETYFPFDPYLLSRSKHYIENLYREYEGGTDVDEEMSGEEEDEDDMFTEDIKSSKMVAMATTPGSFSDRTNVDLMKFGTSPGFSHLT